MTFSGKVGNGPVNKWLDFGGDLDPESDTGKIALAEVCTLKFCNSGRGLRQKRSGSRDLPLQAVNLKQQRRRLFVPS